MPVTEHPKKVEILSAANQVHLFQWLRCYMGLYWLLSVLDN